MNLSSLILFWTAAPSTMRKNGLQLVMFTLEVCLFFFIKCFMKSIRTRDSGLQAIARSSIEFTRYPSFVNCRCDWISHMGCDTCRYSCWRCTSCLQHKCFGSVKTFNCNLLFSICWKRCLQSYYLCYTLWISCPFV